MKQSFCFFALSGIFIFFGQQLDAQEFQNLTESKNEIATTTLIYVSEYFSFVGEDSRGHVAFALDNNRGRDGETWQAEHFVVLHDEQEGWMEIIGNGVYENLNKELLSIPDSPSFQFQGTALTGVTITSSSNKLILSVQPVSERLSRKHKGGQYWMGSAPATLKWAGRTLNGRIIYEYLLIPDFNRLTRTYWGLWDEYQGFYLSIEDQGDVYLHAQQSEMIAPLVGKLDGFLPLANKMGYPMDGYKKFRHNPVESSQFNRIANWVIGGFAMSIVRGEVTREGKVYPVYGLVELIM